jgi:DNA-binding NtrC family response regulator
MRRLTLTVVHHENPALIGRRVQLPDGVTVTLGRGGTTLEPGMLEDRLLSRKHADLRVERDVISVRDLGSLNGTRVNGRPVVGDALVGPGSLIGLGNLLFLVHLAVRGAPFSHPRMVGGSDCMRALHQTLQKAAQHDTAVLLVGETGVGKEVVARELHRSSGRTGAFVPVNCGIIAESMIASELFGHTRGAFSGAQRDRLGVVREAEGGTLLLDEIGDATPALQVALLRFLEEGEVRPVGADRPVRTDVRVVAATHRDLPAAVKAGRFRQDLYQRLARWVVRVPALRDRREDVALLMRHFLRLHDAESRVVPRELALDLVRSSWPGNVRELAAVVERMIWESDAPELRLPDDWDLADPTTDVLADRRVPRVPHPRPAPDELLALLRSRGGNMASLAEELGVGRSTLYRWFREANINPDTARQ